MSKFSLTLSYKNIKILKHSLEQRIEKDKRDFEELKSLSEDMLTEEGKLFITEHIEHLRCLNDLVEEMKICGYRHGQNIFVNNY